MTERESGRQAKRGREGREERFEATTLYDLREALTERKEREEEAVVAVREQARLAKECVACIEAAAPAELVPLTAEGHAYLEKRTEALKTESLLEETLAEAVASVEETRRQLAVLDEWDAEGLVPATPRKRAKTRATVAGQRLRDAALLALGGVAGALWPCDWPSRLLEPARSLLAGWIGSGCTWWTQS